MQVLRSPGVSEFNTAVVGQPIAHRETGLQVEVGFDDLPRPIGSGIDGIPTGVIGIKTARAKHSEKTRPQPIIDIDLIRQG